jgi:hypothetical protein
MCVQATYGDATFQCSDLNLSLIYFFSNDDWDDLVVKAGKQAGQDFCLNVLSLNNHIILRSEKH